MVAPAASSAIHSNRSPAGTADQADGSAGDLDSVGKPLFCGESGYGMSGNRAARRRETGPIGRSLPGTRQKSFSQDIGHAAAETYLITGLSFKLLSYLGVGYRWLTRLFGLTCYAMLLLPGFLQVAYYYYSSNQVRRSIVYGDQPRNRLDLHLPESFDGKKPVVVFVTGGAWIIGYKAWGALLGKQMAERGIIVACLDYRNFPQGTISDMVDDVSEGISFVCSHVTVYGGDPSRIYLMGQSAGAHIAACALMLQSVKEAAGESVPWSVSQIKAYFGSSGGYLQSNMNAWVGLLGYWWKATDQSIEISGCACEPPLRSLVDALVAFALRGPDMPGYNLFNLVDHFHSRGLYRSIFLSIMEGEKSFGQFSPELMVQDKRAKKALSLLPPIILFHGTDDLSIPSDSSKDFADALNRGGAHVELILYKGKTHTDLFLQDPLRGGKDDLFDHVVSVIHSSDREDLSKHVTAPPRRRLVPEILLRLARKVSPF